MNAGPLEHPDLPRFLKMLEGRSKRPDGIAGFVNQVGARGVVGVLAQCLAGPGVPEPGVRRTLAELTRESVRQAGHSVELETDTFAADVGAMLRSVDDDLRVTCGVIVEYLLEAPGHHPRLLGALSATIPPDPPGQSENLSLGAFLVDRPVEPQPRAALARALNDAEGPR